MCYKAKANHIKSRDAIMHLSNGSIPEWGCSDKIICSSIEERLNHVQPRETEHILFGDSWSPNLLVLF